MSGVSFSVDSVVRITVRGELSGKQDTSYGLRKRCDDPLLHRLNEFLHEQGIIPVLVNSRNGCGIHIGYYEAIDAARIQAWLIEQGITQL
ncbi:hypothetical protein KBC54_02125 [Patescibacteria group bacterium]|nr:hypothetical protein [Patescibacteria group bacterium]